ncbi:MAG: putative sigma 54 modulation protein/ribosomal protein [Planctomycetota bacterium]|nr:MAG: putative sigma 54 modulation protein/ribosomal protein [Planctomycetota bacterium]
MPPITRIVERRFEIPDSVRRKIEQRIEKLDEFFDRIGHCVVTVVGPGAHHRKSRKSVHIAISVPKSRIVVNHGGDISLEIAVREAFGKADRQLEDYARRLRGDVKRAVGSGRKGLGRVRTK